MRSHRKQIMRRVKGEMADRNEAVGFIVQGGIQGRIRGYGLIESGLMIASITHSADEESVIIGSPIADPPYPLFLERGFIHHQSGELVGPFPAFEEGLMDSKPAAAAIYGKEIRV